MYFLLITVSYIQIGDSFQARERLPDLSLNLYGRGVHSTYEEQIKRGKSPNSVAKKLRLTFLESIPQYPNSQIHRSTSSACTAL